MQHIYGANVENFPSANHFSLQKAVTWIRKVTNILAYINLKDQNYTKRISLKTELGEKAFSEGLENGWVLHIPAAQFYGQCLVRFRGLAAYALDRDGNTFYDIDVALPSESAQVMYTPDGNPTAFDFGTMSLCRLRGIGPRNLTNRPEINGNPTFFNCSPIGFWKIALDEPSTVLAKSNGLKDLQFDIYIAAQS